MSVESAPRGSLIRLPIGSVIQVSSDNKALKYMTHLVGIDGEKTVISSLPTMKQINKEGAVFDDVFYPERPLIMRVVAGGVVYAFETTIINIYHGQSRLLLSTYPATIQQRNLRNETRYPCTLPADLLFESLTFRSVVNNISQGGCQLLVFPADGIKELLRAKADTEQVAIDIHFPLEDKPETLKARIRTLQIEDDLYKLGLAFEGEKQSVKRFMDALHLESIENWFQT